MPNASPVPQLRLRFTAGVVTRTIVVSESSFTAELPAGEYTVSIANLTEGYAVRSIIYGTSDLLREPLRVAPTATAPQNMPRITVNLAVR